MQKKIPKKKPAHYKKLQENGGRVLFFETVAEICNGIINRLGIIVFRTAMILTVLRSFEAGKLSAEPFLDGVKDEIIVCSDEDFKTALDFAEIAEGTALEVLNRLPNDIIPLCENNLEKKQLKADQRKRAIELHKEGKSIADRARIVLGDEKLKGTIHRWLQ